MAQCIIVPDEIQILVLYFLDRPGLLAGRKP